MPCVHYPVVVGLALAASSPRVRKELRSLTDSEYKLFIDGLNMLINTTTKDGQAKYGSKYVGQKCLPRHS